MEDQSNGSAAYVHGRPGADQNDVSNETIPYTIGRPGNEQTDVSNGSAQYAIGRALTDSNLSNDGYVRPQEDMLTDNGLSNDGYIRPPSKSSQEDIVCNSSGILKDGHGYLILTNSLQGEQVDEIPVPPPRPEEPEYKTPPKVQPDDETPHNFGGSRLVCVALVLVIVLLLISVAGNVYQFVNKSTDEGMPIIAQPPKCPQTVSLQPGASGQISCSLQYITTTIPLSLEIYLMSVYDNKRYTYISEEHPFTNNTEVINDTEYGITTEVKLGTEGLIEIEILYETVKCCHNGDLYVDIADNMLVKLEVNVQVNLLCFQNHSHAVNEVNMMSCTRCFCGDNSTLLSSNPGTWIYKGSSNMTATQLDRVTAEQIVNDSTGLVTYTLLFNKTACFDGGDYTLILPTTENATQQLNFTLQITDIVFGPLSLTRTVGLLSETSISGIPVCISNNPSAFLSSHNLTYIFIGNDDSLEILQAEDMLVVSNLEDGMVDVIPAAQQNFVMSPYIQNSTQFRPSFQNGLLNIDVYFNKVQCHHGGLYQFYVDDMLLYNLTVFVDDTAERTQTVIYQIAEETGFVETYNITLECAARVGCTKRPYIIEPSIDTYNNATLNYSLIDINSDDIMDVFIATITSTVLDIPMSLNNTQFTCMVTGDSLKQDLVYNIYVLEGSFCDSRPVNCEYVYPYRTDITCKWWVSCLDDRPRVKLCHLDNTYYHEQEGQCSGTCDFGCPWNP